ncbi:MAG: AsmA family protein [Nibricoccus sp.]
MKKLLIILAGLFVVTVVAIIIIIAKLGTIVKTAVNTAGPKITQTTVVLKEADISPFSGKGALKELTIGNPKGWTSEHAFFLREISIHLEPKSLTSDHIVVNSIVIDNPEIIYETTITNSNLQDLIKNIQQSAGGTQQAQTEPKPETTAPQPAKTEPAKEPKIEIKSFRLANVTVKGIAAGKSYSVTLPEFVMTDIGTKEGGLTPQELSIAIIKEISIRVAKAAAVEAGKRGLLDKAGEGLRDLLGGKK